jgi:hypothetical protein
LNEQTPWPWPTFELAIEKPERPRTEVIGQPPHAYPRIGVVRAVAWWSPDLDTIAGGGQSARDQTCVIADAARLWRILAGENVPVHGAVLVDSWRRSR